MFTNILVFTYKRKKKSSLDELEEISMAEVLLIPGQSHQLEGLKKGIEFIFPSNTIWWFLRLFTKNPTSFEP